MKLVKREAELGEWYSEKRGWDIVDTVMLMMVLGAIILAMEYTGLSDALINYFND